MDTATLPKLCHRCGQEIETNREWQYQRSGVFDSLAARCRRCDIEDRRDEAQAGVMEAYTQLVKAYQKLAAVLDEARRAAS